MTTLFQTLPQPAYFTRNGACYLGDSLKLLRRLPGDCVDLVVTSPPFALLRQKAYGNRDQEEYVTWLCAFGNEIRRVLRDTGSFVLDLGGAYQRGVPVRSLHQYRVLLKMCDEVGFYLAEEFFWYNPAKLPSPIEWVNKRKLRAKDAVNTLWWFSKSEWPKADVRQVLVPYSERMKTLLRNPEAFYRPKNRPSGHGISSGFGTDNGGAIPSNLLRIPNTESSSSYLRLCKLVGVKPHPARFPAALPEFFIRFLTTEQDLVLDIFAGSNTTGYVAEQLGRKWIALELDASYVAGSALRFMESLSERDVTRMFASFAIGSRNEPVDLSGLPTLFDLAKVERGTW
ncbi:MAG: site-specific DNA-methyltransferase [Chloracidobacterium sp.]|uniref:Methyltransferase n=1 Tax=Chloracidobacterium validum TaxID=2821543 RepID=A0ABX8BB66_9BACT|nr:site-specific DNA-methyltransferase [Chloracidobacterium validum]QUW04179.1 site-specific DNA-methyltransferase [Chloracidobacterium validum]